MPNLAAWHPQVVHFVIALAFVGVGARVVSLLPLGERFRFTNAMATALIVLAALAGVVAARSGTDAHGPVERVPGAREAVQEHEDAGEWARTALLCLAVLEIATLALSNKAKLGTPLRFASALGGLVALAVVYRAAEHGGVLVYNYAGGVGLRSGDTTDVRRLLVAGLFHDAMREREAGRKTDAARLIGELVRQMPNDTFVTFLSAESLIKDQSNGRAALGILTAITLQADNPRFQLRKGMLTADAYVAAGVPDSARIVLEALKARVPAGPGQQRIQQAIDKLPGAGA